MSSKVNFKVDDLKEQFKKVNKVKQESYKKVLNHCYSHMKMVSKMGKTECVYEIPYIVDAPIDIDECAIYLGEHLDKDKIKYYFHSGLNSMFITWAHLINSNQ
jgi:hypothetical protein